MGAEYMGNNTKMNFFSKIVYLSITTAYIVEKYRYTVDIQDRFVRSEIAVKVSNPNDSDEEYNFQVKLDESEFISSLTLKVGEKVTFGKVKEKDVAEKEYQVARKNNKNTALTSADKKENFFSTKINIPSNETGFIWLTFEKQLPRKKSKYTHEALVKTFGIVQDVEIFVKINESRPLTFSTVQVGQTQLTQEDSLIRTEKAAEYRFSEKNQDFSEKIDISYDVERPAVGGDIIIRDGYFVHFIGSDDIPEKNKTVIFVIDRSGSMLGDRIEKVKQAYSILLNELPETDRINIHTFSTDVQSMLESSDLLRDEIWQKSQKYVDQISAEGGTNLYIGLEKALQEAVDDDNAGIIFLLSDGEVNTGLSDWAEIQKRTKRMNENRFAIFSFAISDKAPFKSLEKLSLENGGLARQIFNDHEVEDSVTEFYRSVAHPLLWNFKASYNNIERTEISDKKLNKVYNIPYIFYSNSEKINKIVRALKW